MSMHLGSIPVLEVRVVASWTGPWIADCDLDLAHDAPMPTGLQSLTIGSTTLVGTIEAKASGPFGDKARARLVAGGGGWSTVLKPIHLHNDAAGGIPSTQALAAVASQIGETVVDSTPVTYVTDWEFFGGPAVGALEGRQWYVDANGVTQVAAWPTLARGSDVDVLMYDPETRRAELAADELVWPGTTITDLRFGTITVRDVDQRFTAAGSRVTVWHSSTPGSRFNSLLQSIASLGGQQWLRVYRYRIVNQGTDGRLQLQAVNRTIGIPDTLPLSVWPGIPGVTAKFALGAGLGSMVSVVFLDGDKTLPRVVNFDGTPPSELHFDASTLLQFGAGAISPAAKGDLNDSNFIAAKTFASAVGVVLASLIPASGVTAGQLTTFAAALSAFLLAIAPTAATKVTVQ